MDNGIKQVYDEIRAYIKSLSFDDEIISLLQETALEYDFESIYEMLMNNVDIVLQFLMLKVLGNNENFGYSEKKDIEELTEIGDILLLLEIDYTWNDIYLKKLNKIDFLRLINNFEILCANQKVFQIFGYTMALGNVFYMKDFYSKVRLKITSLIMGFASLHATNKNYAFRTVIEFIENTLSNEVYTAERKLR